VGKEYLEELWWTTPMNKLLWYVNMIFMEEMINLWISSYGNAQRVACSTHEKYVHTATSKSTFE